MTEVVRGRKWIQSRYGSALCGVPVAQFPESGEQGKPGNATCPRCRARYRKISKAAEGEQRAVAAIEAEGWTVRFVGWCEDARTPGLLGQITGVTDWERREVKIGLRATQDPGQREAALDHELRHIREPGWDCGNRDVLGRGGPAHA